MEKWKRLALAEPDRRRRADYGGLALVFAELASRRQMWKLALEGWNVVESQQVLEWQAEAEAKFAHEAIVTVLERQLKKPLAADLVAIVENETDPVRLRKWHALALECNSAEEFLASIGRV